MPVDAGNTTTLAHYIQLLHSAGLLRVLPKYAPNAARQRMSIPKWQVQNSALFSALTLRTFAEVQADPIAWGQWIEMAIGVHLLRVTHLSSIELFYWREGNDEVDFVIMREDSVIGLDVKSGLFSAKNAPG